MLQLHCMLHIRYPVNPTASVYSFNKFYLVKRATQCHHNGLIHRYVVWVMPSSNPANRLMNTSVLNTSLAAIATTRLPEIEFIMNAKLYQCYRSEVIADLISDCRMDLFI